MAIVVIVVLLTSSVVSWCLLSLVAGRLSILHAHPYAPFFYKSLATTLPGLVLTLALNPAVGYSSVLSSHGATRAAQWLAYSLVAFPFGAILSVVVWNRSLRYQFGLFSHQTIVSNTSSSSESPAKWHIRLSVLLVLLIAIVACYVYTHLPSIPLLVLTASPDAIARARGAATWGFLGNQYVLTVLGLTFVPLCDCVAFALFLHYRTRLLKWLFCLSCLLTLLTVFYNGAKAPPLDHIWSLYMVYVYAAGSKPSSKQLAVVALLATMAMLLMFHFMMGVDFASNFDIFHTGSMAARAVFGQMQSLVAHFEVFPSVVPFQQWASVAGFLSRQQADTPARIVMKWMNPAGVEQGKAGYAAAYYIGSAWADFGVAGVVLMPVLVGFLWTSLFVFVTRRWSPVRAGVLAYLAGWFGTQAQASGTRLLYFPELVLSIVLLLFCVLCARRLPPSFKRRGIG